MEFYARRNELPDALHLIAATRSTLSRLIAPSDQVCADQVDVATPRQWFEDLVEELARVADIEGAPEARDKLFDARDAWGRQKDQAPATGAAVASRPADKSDDRP